jgi:hypothetical protein
MNAHRMSRREMTWTHCVNHPGQVPHHHHFCLIDSIYKSRFSNFDCLWFFEILEFLLINNLNFLEWKNLIYLRTYKAKWKQFENLLIKPFYQA